MAEVATEPSTGWGIFKDFAGGKDGKFFRIVPDHVDLKKKPGFSNIPKPTILQWLTNAITLRHVWASPNTVWSLMALAMYFLVPYDLSAGSAASKSPLSLGFFKERLPLWTAVTFGYTAFWHVTLYFFGWAERPFIPSRKYNYSKVLHNMAYSLSGVIIWVGFENVFAFLWATGRLPYLSDGVAFSTRWGFANFLLGIALIPVWRDAHFYFAHRFLHYRPMYNRVHSLHHRNTDIEPFAGLCMHPMEHLYYYSCILPNLYFMCSPLHFLWNGVHLLIAPGASHSGYEDHFQADAFHYLHHRNFECNYAGLGAAALDVFFDTFTERFAEADGDKVVMERADEKSTLIGIPPITDMLYMLLSCACVAAWALVACWGNFGGALGPLPPFLAPAAVKGSVAQLYLSLLAGFGPVVLASVMAGPKYIDDCVKEWVKNPSGMFAATFHIIMGTLFCSVPITWACYLAF